MKQQGNSGKNSAKRIALGAGVSLLAYLALLALLTLLIVRGTVGEAGTGICVWVFACLAAFAGANAAAWRTPEPLALIAASVAAFWGLVVLSGFFANDGLNLPRAAALALPVLLGGTLAYLLRGGKKKGKRKRRSRK